MVQRSIHLLAVLSLLLFMTPASMSQKAAAQEADVAEAPAKQAANGQAESKSDPKSDENTQEKVEKKAEKKAEEKSDKKDNETGEESPEKAKLEKARLAYMSLKGGLSEGAPSASLLGELTPDLASVLSRIKKAGDDENIHGLILEFQGLSVGYGQVNELRAAIERFRETGKKVHAYMEVGTTPDYLVAIACDDITMPESGYMMVPGVRTEATFFKGVFDMLGVEADFLHMGEAKGYAETYTRRSFSKPVEANMTALVDSLYGHVIDTITNDRPMKRAVVVECVDRGLLTATAAAEAKMIDRVAYSDQLKSELTEAYDAEELVYVMNYGKKKIDTDFSGPTGMFKLLKLLSGTDSGKPSTGNKIAVVYAVGPINSGKSGSSLLGGTTLGSETIVEALQKANDDENVVAIVLRIDSPGGSAVASDMMWRQIESLDKPIIASMGDTAASGGYYIAMGCDKIFAEPGTVTGSIGVVGGKIAFGRVMQRFGVDTTVIARGQNSGLFSVSNGFTDSEREVFHDMMEETYEQFTSKAAEGRGMKLDRLKELAGGKVYTGLQAKENGLIDELGTLHDAIQEAKKLAKLDADEEIKIETLPEPVDFFESLFGDNEDEREVTIDLGLDKIAPELAAVAKKAQAIKRMFAEPVVLTMPFDLEIK